MKIHRSMRRGAIAAVAAGALVAPAGAAAHVTVQPQSGVPEGGFSRLDIRVPNERDKGVTTSVKVDIPPGFYSVNYLPTPGWTAKVAKEKLATPAEQFGEKVTEQVKDITWTADSTKDGIQPGQFQQFGISGATPGKAGAKLSFPAIQTYEGPNEVVRWIDKNPEGDTPASTLLILPKAEAAAATTKPATATPTAAKSSGDDGDFASKGLGIAALIIGGLGLLIGIAAFAASRGRPGAAA
jgi:uncharacterized protein YcnI